MKATELHDWEQYTADEMAAVRQLLATRGYTLDPEQVHLSGERYLMSGKKLVLLGHAADGTRVIIKASSNPEGVAEIAHERARRKRMHALSFALYAFHTPLEYDYFEEGAYTVLATLFVSQDQALVTRPDEEQFFLSLQILEALEGAHAAARTHMHEVQNVLADLTTDDYLRSFTTSRTHTSSNDPSNTKLLDALTHAETKLREHRTLIARFCGFLTHTDLVPHNLRINGSTIHLLDTTSLTLGNKYDGWARLVNFMTLHNPKLEHLLLTYVRGNRGEDEYKMLHLMRIYKLGYLLEYYTNALLKSTDAQQTLARARVTFWTEVLIALLEEKPLPESVRSEYISTRDALRSQEERSRQEEIFGRN